MATLDYLWKNGYRDGYSLFSAGNAAAGGTSPPRLDDPNRPLSWRGITEDGDTATNYQLMPGDRVFVASYPLVRADNAMARALAPVERALGIILLGNSTKQSLRNNNGNNINNNNFVQ